MKQKELLEKYLQKNILEEVSFSKAFRYFKSAREFYKNLQDGVADEDNFFENTMVMYEECDRPDRDPDYDSDSGSRYWYTNDGVIRGSDHWGCGVFNCDWPLKLRNGKTLYGTYWKNAKSIKDPKYGFARWNDFLFKARPIEIDGQTVITSFNNTVGRDLIKLNDKIYQRKIIEVFEEVE